MLDTYKYRRSSAAANECAASYAIDAGDAADTPTAAATNSRIAAHHPMSPERVRCFVSPRTVQWSVSSIIVLWGGRLGELELK